MEGFGTKILDGDIWVTYEQFIDTSAESECTVASSVTYPLQGYTVPFTTLSWLTPLKYYDRSADSKAFHRFMAESATYGKDKNVLERSKYL